MTTQKIFTREFAIISIAQFAFASGFHLLLPTLPIYLSRLGSLEAEIGVLIGAFGVFGLFLRPFIGRALLRVPERNFMILGALVYVLSPIGYLLAPPFWPFFMVRCFHGIGMAFFTTSSFTLVAKISPEAHLGQSLSYFYLAVNIGSALAPYFGMVLINRFNFAALFLVSTGLSLCCLFITTKLGKRKIEPLPNLSIQDQPFLSREALPASIMILMASIVWGAVITFFPIYALSHGITNPGLFFGVMSIMLILVRSLSGKILDIYSRETVILPCLILYIISMVILAFSTTLEMFILVAMIFGIGNAFLYPILMVHALDHAGTSRGQAMGTFTAAVDLGIFVGSVMMGIVLQLTNFMVMFLCLALTSVINLLYFHISIRKKG